MVLDRRETKFEKEYIVSFRPLAGTSEIHVDQVIETEELPRSTQPTLPYKMK